MMKRENGRYKKTQMDVHEIKKKKHYLKLKNTLDVIKNRSYKFEEKISEPKT